MTAFQHARQLYVKAGYDPSDILTDMERHAASGYIVATPCEFALARPVALAWGEYKICDTSDDLLTDNELTLPLDCWHITVAVGCMGELLSHLPFSLPYISYERRGQFHAKKLSRYESKKSEAATATGTDSASPRKRA